LTGRTSERSPPDAQNTVFRSRLFPRYAPSKHEAVSEIIVPPQCK
jgi:hypothetical protein